MSAPPPAAPPERLGAYRVRGLLGAGRDTAVYLADTASSPRRFALKAALKAPAPQAVARLRREAALAAALRHPHIVTVHAYEEDERYGFIVMDHVDGAPLSRHLNGTPLPPQQALDWTGQLLAALAHAHARGVTHGDVKPANLLIDTHGQLRLTDFGLAVEAGMSPAATAVGTPAYMAPEQLRGAVPEPRSDLFAVGVVLYRLLTGVAPFHGTPFQIVQQILGPAPVPPSHLLATLDGRFDAPLGVALAAAPALRYQTASDFAAALRAISQSAARGD